MMKQNNLSDRNPGTVLLGSEILDMDKPRTLTQTSG